MVRTIQVEIEGVGIAISTLLETFERQPEPASVAPGQIFWPAHSQPITLEKWRLQFLSADHPADEFYCCAPGGVTEEYLRDWADIRLPGGKERLKEKNRQSLREALPREYWGILDN